MITKFKIYENYTNKFNFEIGKSYNYDELPKQVKKDIDVQFDDDYNDEYTPEDYDYIFKLLTTDELGEYLDDIFGHNLGDELDSPYIRKLVNNIKKNGLDYPAVGLEGNHRALAFFAMNKPLPYLEMKLKDDL